jgi:hypothetical protein
VSERDQTLKSELRADLESARSAFYAVTDSLSEEDRRQPSNIPGWSNEQLLFHMVFGFLLLPSLVRIIRFWALFPRGFSRPFAALLNFSTPAFNWINGLGPRPGARIYRGKSLVRKFDRAFVKVLKILDSTNTRELTLGMHYPQRWDPLFTGYVTMEQLFRYPPAHLKSHLKQLRCKRD